MKRALIIVLVASAGVAAAPHRISGAPIPVSALQRATPVDFEKEILPIFRENCLACHCQTTSKAHLILETPESMIKGGETGPAVVPGKGAESLAIKAAAHQDDDLTMPPRDNKAKAKDLTSDQLALVSLWIDQGAKASPKSERVLHWQPVPDPVRAILAVDVTPDGQFAACARANRLFIYHLPTAKCVVNELAGRDQINALAFSPDGTRLAAAGYREVKLWHRDPGINEHVVVGAGARVAVSADGKWIATGGDDGNVKLWQFAGLSPGPVIAAAKGAVTGMIFSPDSLHLVCVSTDKSISVWNIADQKQVARVETAAELNAVVCMADKVISGGADGVIHVWTDALVAVKDLPGHSGAVNALATQGAQLVSGGADGSVRLWDIEKGSATVQMNHGAPVAAVAIRPDGKRFASAGQNNLAKLWDPAGKPVAEMKGNRLADERVGARDRQLQLANGNVSFRKEVAQNAEKQLQAAKDQIKKAGEAVPMRQKELEEKQKAADEAREAKAGADKAAADADAALKASIESLEAADKAAQQAKTDADALKAKSPPDQPAIDKAFADAKAKTDEAAKAKNDREQRQKQAKEAADKIMAAAKKLTEMEANLKRAVVARAAADTEVTLSKSEEEKATAALAEAKTAIESAEAEKKRADDELQGARKAAPEAAKPVRAIAFSPDSLVVATAGEDQLVHTWSAENGAACEVLAAHKASVGSLAYASTGGLISAAQDNELVVWNANPSWKVERSIGTGDGSSPLMDRVCALAFNSDGKLLATGGGEPSRGGEIKVWNVGTGGLVRDLPNIHTDTVLGLQFSPDDKFLASGAADRMARLISLESGKVIRGFEGHTQHVLALSWSPDGRTLATAGADAMVKTWDVATGDRKKNFEGYDKEVTAVRFAGAGDRLVTASGDNKVRLLSPDGNQIRAFGDVADFMDSAAVTADGQTVVAGGNDSILRLWNAADGKAVASFGPTKE